MQPHDAASIGVGACPHSGNAGRDWSDPVTGLGRPIIGHPGSSCAPTTRLSHCYLHQSRGQRRPAGPALHAVARSRFRLAPASTGLSCGLPLPMQLAGRRSGPAAPPFAWKQQPCLSAATRNAHGHPSALQGGGAGAPLARQRGGRPRWRDTAAESTGAPARRRSCGPKGVDAGGPLRARGARPGKDAARAGGGGHVLRRSLRSLRSVIRRQDPPATDFRPAERQRVSGGASP